MNDLKIRKTNICSHTDQIYEIFYLNCYILKCFIHLSMLRNVNSRLTKDLTFEKAIYVAKVNCYMLNYLIQFSMLESLNSGLRQISGIKKAFDVAIVIKLMEHLI